MRGVNKPIVERPGSFGSKVDGVLFKPREITAFLQPGVRFLLDTLPDHELIEAMIDRRTFRHGKADLHRKTTIQIGLADREEEEYSVWGHTDEHAFTICNPFGRKAKTGFFKTDRYPEAQAAGLEEVLRLREDALRKATRDDVRKAIQRLEGKSPLNSAGVKLAKTLAADPAIGPQEIIAYQNKARETAGPEGYTEADWERGPDDNIRAVQMTIGLRHFRAVHTEADFLEPSSLCTISAKPGR